MYRFRRGGFQTRPCRDGRTIEGGLETRPSKVDFPDRRSIRLKGYDYSRAGAYFVTICTWNRACLFGEVAAGEMSLNDFGRIVRGVWDGLAAHYDGMDADAFAVMPNHVHGIVVLNGGEPRAGLKPAPTRQGDCKPAPTLSEIVRGFKTFSARRINQLRGTSGVPVWQRNYHEHVIRDDNALNGIREYIVNNPMQWESDRENLATVREQPIPKGEPWRV